MNIVISDLSDQSVFEDLQPATVVYLSKLRDEYHLYLMEQAKDNLTKSDIPQSETTTISPD